MNPKVSLVPVDGVAVTALVDNLVDIFMPDEGPAERRALSSAFEARRRAGTLVGRQAPEQLVAEHGFSVLVEVTAGKRRHCLLFDAGVSPDGLIENMKRLDVDPRSVEAVVMSHGHFDHTTGLDGFIRAVGRPNLPVLLHPHFWHRRRIRLPGREPWELPSTSKRALEGAGFQIVEERSPSFLLDESVLVTGEIDRTTEFERGFPIQDSYRDGAWTPDPLVLDDQGVVVNVAGRGLLVITGCGHSGIINTIQHAQKLTGVERVYAVIGGFHLNGPLFEPQIPEVIKQIEVIDPEILVPAHCTGWRAVHALARRFPDKVIPSSVGTVFRL